MEKTYSEPVTLGAETRGRAVDSPRRARPLAADERIDPSTAPEEELDRLPKVGPGQARRIVAWRQAHGPFRSLADLDSVPGMGPAALAAVAPHVTLAPAAASAPPATPANRTGAGHPAIPAGAGSPVISVNSASAQELTRLPGIGPSLAGRIVAWREGHGAFRSLDDLARVPGIGPATVARIRASGAAGP